MRYFKTGLTVILIMFLISLNVMASEQPYVTTDNNAVKVEGKLSEFNANVTLVIMNENDERQYLDQTKTDESGNFIFKFSLEDGSYTGKLSTELNHYTIEFVIKNGTSQEPENPKEPDKPINPGTGGGSGGGTQDPVQPVDVLAAEDVRKGFNDIENHWAKNEIELLAGKGIITGMGDGIFKPEDKITRAQFATLIVNLLNINTEEYTGRFLDVKENDWFALFVEAAAKEGIVLGAEGLFNPNKEITREEMALVIVRAMEHKGIVVKSVSLSFTDKDNISSWALDSVGKAFEKGIIKGMTETKFEPKLYATRAQAAVMIYRLMNLF